MAIVRWTGNAPAVAQVSTGEITAHDAASTYTVTMGNQAIGLVGDTDVATTAAALVSLLNASTHPYFAQVTWTNPSTGIITGTADEAGDPFVASLTVTGGTGTVTNFSDSTACTGPHHVDEALNYSGGSLPTTSDDLVIESGASMLYGLAALTSVALARCEIRKAFTSRVGLEKSQFSTVLDGETTDPNVPEYRSTYLEVSADEVILGEHISAGAPAGSPRICIKQTKAGASVLDVVSTASNAVNNRPAVRFLAAHASADVIVKSAPGGVGVAIEAGETSTVGDFHLVDDTAASTLYVGQGVTWTSYEQHGGAARIAAAASPTSVVCRGGALTIAGYDYLIATLDVHGGSVVDVHENTGGAEWTTINSYGGLLELPRSTVSGSRAYTTMNLYGGRIEADWSALTGTEVIASVGGVSVRRAVEISDL